MPAIAPGRAAEETFVGRFDPRHRVDQKRRSTLKSKVFDKAAIIIQDGEFLEETEGLACPEARPWTVWRREVVDPIETLSVDSWEAVAPRSISVSDSFVV